MTKIGRAERIKEIGSTLVELDATKKTARLNCIIANDKSDAEIKELHAELEKLFQPFMERKLQREIASIFIDGEICVKQPCIQGNRFYILVFQEHPSGAYTISFSNEHDIQFESQGMQYGIWHKVKISEIEMNRIKSVMRRVL